MAAAPSRRAGARAAAGAAHPDRRAHKVDDVAVVQRAQQGDLAPQVLAALHQAPLRGRGAARAALRGFVEDLDGHHLPAAHRLEHLPPRAARPVSCRSRERARRALLGPRGAVAAARGAGRRAGAHAAAGALAQLPVGAVLVLQHLDLARPNLPVVPGHLHQHRVHLRAKA